MGRDYALNGRFRLQLRGKWKRDVMDCIMLTMSYLMFDTTEWVSAWAVWAPWLLQRLPQIWMRVAKVGHWRWWRYGILLVRGNAITGVVCRFHLRRHRSILILYLEFIVSPFKENPQLHGSRPPRLHAQPLHGLATMVDDLSRPRWWESEWASNIIPIF